MSKHEFLVGAQPKPEIRKVSDLVAPANLSLVDAQCIRWSVLYERLRYWADLGRIKTGARLYAQIANAHEIMPISWVHARDNEIHLKVDDYDQQIDVHLSRFRSQELRMGALSRDPYVICESERGIYRPVIGIGELLGSGILFWRGCRAVVTLGHVLSYRERAQLHETV